MVSLYGKFCEEFETGKISSGTGRNRAEPAEEKTEPADPAAVRETTGRLDKRRVVFWNGRSFFWTTCRLDRLPQ